MQGIYQLVSLNRQGGGLRWNFMGHSSDPHAGGQAIKTLVPDIQGIRAIVGLSQAPVYQEFVSM
jgi:hypothetical protein